MQTQLKISESNPLSIIAYRDSAKCVCERERERESVCVCVCVIDRRKGNGEEGRAEGGRGFEDGGGEGRGLRVESWIKR